MSVPSPAEYIISKYTDSPFPYPASFFSIDSLLLDGFDFYFDLFWMAGHWKPAILLAARRWGPTWVNKRVCVETDNTQAMSFINKGTCKNPIAMTWLREIFWLSVRYNFHLRSRHLPGKFNHNADRLSRLLQHTVLSPAVFTDLFSTPQDTFRSWITGPSSSPQLPMPPPP